MSARQRAPPTRPSRRPPQRQRRRNPRRNKTRTYPIRSPAAAKPDPVSATDAWDRLQVGSYVVGKYWQSDGTPYGWWLGIIASIDKNDFYIRWPDEPLTPALKIER